MAQKITLVDDLDGSTIDDDGSTVRFAFDGTSYEIDLTTKNADKLRSILEPYTNAARRVRSGGSISGFTIGSSPRKSDPARLKAIREWANANGRPVADRGRIPNDITEAYDAAN
jgi:hypothetical protein